MKNPFEIRRALASDVSSITDLARTTFIESHSKSAPEEAILSYVSDKFTPKIIEKELSNSENIFHIATVNKEPIAYSKINLNTTYKTAEIAPLTKLERIYLLEKYHGKGIGEKLFKFNIELSKSHFQKGMWLFVWVGNHKAIQFYNKMGFQIVGEHNFKISETHYNPNHQLCLIYD